MTSREIPTYENYLQFNDLPEIEFDLNQPGTNLPPFAQEIVTISLVSNEGGLKFLNKFMSYYIMEDNFVKTTFDGCIFLFLDRDYIGIFPSESSIRRYINENNIQYSRMYKVPMYDGEPTIRDGIETIINE